MTLWLKNELTIIPNSVLQNVKLLDQVDLVKSMADYL